MRCLKIEECCGVSAAMSNSAKLCLEGGMVGALIGGFAGGLIISPFYHHLLNRNGISASHYLMGSMMYGASVFIGGVAGSFVGSGSSWMAACSVSTDQGLSDGAGD